MRASLIISTFAAFLLVHSPATAQVTAPPSIIADIEADGYTITDIARSWLGRIVITARKGGRLREVVLNRSSGEILRDQRFPIVRGGPVNPSTRPDRPGMPGGPSGPQGPGRPGPGGG